MLTVSNNDLICPVFETLNKNYIYWWPLLNSWASSWRVNSPENNYEISTLPSRFAGSILISFKSRIFALGKAVIAGYRKAHHAPPVKTSDNVEITSHTADFFFLFCGSLRHRNTNFILFYLQLKTSFIIRLWFSEKLNWADRVYARHDKANRSFWANVITKLS